MSDKPHSQQASESLRATAAARDDSAHAGHGPRDGGGQDDQSAAGEGENRQGAPETVAAEAPRLMVVPGEGAAAAPAAPVRSPAALAALRARRLAAIAAAQEAAAARGRAAGGDMAENTAVAVPRPVPGVTPVARTPVAVPVRPVPARATPLEAWPELFKFENSLQDMRRTRRRRFFGRLALIVGIPTLLMAFYVFLWATPRYVSEFEITYQNYQNTQTLSSGLVQSLLGSGSSNSDPGSILYEYARSGTLLKKLDAQLNLRKYYSSSHVDYPARLRADASDEAFLNYYRSHVVSVSEGLGGYLTVDVQAFDPEFAQTLAKAIVKACDEMVDEMTTRARQDSIKFADDEVTREEDRVRQAQIAETRFQNEHRDLNPTNTATQFGQIVGSLETQLSQARTALTNTLSYASPNAPQVQQLKNQIAALEAQLQDQRSRLTGGGDKAYSQILEDYSRLQLEEQFAQNAYLAAQQGLAVARADAARKQSYLVDFVTPNYPDRPTRAFYIDYLASALLGSLFLYAVVSLMGGAFRDQAGL
jgi:capsular polysaccharide transport system permease protein